MENNCSFDSDCRKALRACLSASAASMRRAAFATTTARCSTLKKIRKKIKKILITEPTRSYKSRGELGQQQSPLRLLIGLIIVLIGTLSTGPTPGTVGTSWAPCWAGLTLGTLWTWGCGWALLTVGTGWTLLTGLT